jgi:hypothetical protein
MEGVSLISTESKSTAHSENVVVQSVTGCEWNGKNKYAWDRQK